MNRRDAIRALLAIGATAAPIAADAQAPLAGRGGRVARVGVLTTSLSEARVYLNATIEGLRERGWVQGKNLVLDVRSPETDVDLYPKFAAELVAAKPDVILATTYLAVLAVTDESESIPVVFAAISDPVKAGLVKSLARPGGQLTGVAFGGAPLVGKRIEILKDAFPGLTRLAVLYDVDRQGDAGMAELRAAAQGLGIVLLPLGASRPEEIERAFAEMRRSAADAVLVPTSIRFFFERRRIVALAARYRLPAIYEHHLIADEGGLMAYGPNFVAGFRRAAHHIDRILRGARPGDLPIEEAMRYDLVVNLRTARAAGIQLSPRFVGLAGRVIE